MRCYQKNCQFDYGQARLGDVKTYGVRSTRTGRVTLTGIEIHGELFAPSLCFWRSFFHRFSISTDVLRLYDPSEVFERVVQRESRTNIRYCIERDPDGSSTIVVVCASAETSRPSNN